MALSLVPFDDRDGWIWLDGEFVAWRDAKLHVLSHALHYASCVFEGERSYGGTIFELSQHSERLHQSASLLDFQIPYTVAEIDQACKATITRMGYSDAYVRPLAWRGAEQMGVSAPNSRIHVAIASWQWPSYFDPEAKMRGVRLARAKYRRPSPETAPVHSKAAGLYMICTLSKHAAERDGYADALMLDWRGYVAEATGANIFFVRDGVIHTPLPDCFLDGITRRSVIGLAQARGWEVVERHIQEAELPSFSECFITGTAAEVTPVSEIAGQPYTPGEVSRTLVEDYGRLVRGEALGLPAEADQPNSSPMRAIL